MGHAVTDGLTAAIDGLVAGEVGRVVLLDSNDQIGIRQRYYIAGCGAVELRVSRRADRRFLIRGNWHRFCRLVRKTVVGNSLKGSFPSGFIIQRALSHPREAVDNAVSTEVDQCDRLGIAGFKAHCQAGGDI